MARGIPGRDSVVTCYRHKRVRQWGWIVLGPIDAARIGFELGYARWHEYRMKQRYGEAWPDPRQLLYVDPAEFDFKIDPFFFGEVPSRFSTYVRPGDWDRDSVDPTRTFPSDYPRDGTEKRLVPIESMDRYQSFIDHFTNGVPWRDTALYHRRIDEGFQTRRYDSEEGMLEHFERLDRLYESLKTDGYLTQEELATSTVDTLRGMGWWHEIIVNIGRDGELVLDDGRNRFLLAKILGLNPIPVRVLVRHETWFTSLLETRQTGIDDRVITTHPDYPTHDETQHSHPDTA